jgi:2-amino-4-hydroxy-6-hydroxymethyldihydropteridine diphosphokinase
MHKVYLSLGSNIGDTRSNLDQALLLLKEKIVICKRSSYYKTEPVDFKDQDWFLNRVLEGETDLEPFELLSFTQSIESTMKRVKTRRFGPRLIDIDILLYDGLSIDAEILTIPHPRMRERAFVLVPLLEIAPDLKIGRDSVKKILDGLEVEGICMIDKEIQEEER